MHVFLVLTEVSTHPRPYVVLEPPPSVGQSKASEGSSHLTQNSENIVLQFPAWPYATQVLLHPIYFFQWWSRLARSEDWARIANFGAKENRRCFLRHEQFHKGTKRRNTLARYVYRSAFPPKFFHNIKKRNATSCILQCEKFIYYYQSNRKTLRLFRRSDGRLVSNYFLGSGESTAIEGTSDGKM